MSTSITLLCLFLLSIVYYQLIRYPKKYKHYCNVYNVAYILPYITFFTHSFDLCSVLIGLSIVITVITLIRGNAK